MCVSSNCIHNAIRHYPPKPWTLETMWALPPHQLSLPSRKGKIKTIHFIPIKEDATRIAALISGDVDIAFPISIQDWDRIESSKNLALHTGIEACVIFLGFDQHRDVLIGAEKGATKIHSRIREYEKL